MAALDHGAPLCGLWCAESLHRFVDSAEWHHWDCFPSGHTELTILACWGSQMVSRRLFYLFLGYTPCIIFATVYLRYHYTVDVLAGAVVAAGLICLAPVLYRNLSKGSIAIGRN